MDPDATWKLLRDSAEDYYRPGLDDERRSHILTGMVNLFTDLDDWLVKGGFPPKVFHVGDRQGDFTQQEWEVWERVRQAASAYLKLTDEEPSHSMERSEICTAFHDIQARLAIRPVMRKLTET